MALQQACNFALQSVAEGAQQGGIDRMKGLEFQFFLLKIK
jgi:hypothetical protein